MEEIFNKVYQKSEKIHQKIKDAFTKDPLVSFKGIHVDKNKDISLQKQYENSFWFTYRKNFKVLLENIDYKNKQLYTTDKNWGCMLRVGQNLLAETLRRYFFENQIDQPPEQILSEFQDQEKSRYSIHNIAKLAYEDFNMLPGEWYQPNKIMGCLQKIQENNPMPKSENLKILTLNSDVPIIFQQIEEKLQNKKNNTKNNSLLLVINSRIGLEDTPPHYLKIIKLMLQFELCMGIIGGNMGSAHYFIGTKEDQLIFMDPHTTQEASTDKNFKEPENIKSYQCKQIKYLPLKQINQTLGIAFFLSNMEDFQIFKQFITVIQKQFPDFFWYFMEETPDYLKEGYQAQEYEEEETDDGFIIMH